MHPTTTLLPTRKICARIYIYIYIYLSAYPYRNNQQLSYEFYIYIYTYIYIYVYTYTYVYRCIILPLWSHFYFLIFLSEVLWGTSRSYTKHPQLCIFMYIDALFWLYDFIYSSWYLYCMRCGIRRVPQKTNYISMLFYAIINYNMPHVFT